MNERDLRMLRHLAGVMAEAAGGILAILDGPDEPDIPEPSGPVYFGDDDKKEPA